MTFEVKSYDLWVKATALARINLGMYNCFLDCLATAATKYKGML